jgi:hypothetical protein
MKTEEQLAELQVRHDRLCAAVRKLRAHKTDIVDEGQSIFKFWLKETDWQELRNAAGILCTTEW